MPGTASISGIVSGLQTDEIIAKLMELEAVPVQRMEARKADLEDRLKAWQDLNTRILALQDKARTLYRATTFDAKTVTSSDDTIVSGTASSSAAAGTYFLTVNQLARTHQIKSQGFADIDTTTVGTGTVSIQVGSGDVTEITVDGTNNTLAGLRDAINRADAGVKASIINDGSGTPYRLIVTSDTMGTEGQITLTSSLSGGTAPTFTDLQAAQDASITMGEGAGAITVTKSSNTVTDLIPGLTLNLAKADSSTPVMITIANDTETAKEAIQGFVEQFNNLMTFIDGQFDYNADTNATGTLFGDSNLRALQSDLRSKISNPLTGVSQSIVLLSQIGITTSNDLLVVDETKLDEALKNDLSAVVKLFASVGEASNSGVQYISSTDATEASGETGFAINITAVATQARVTAGMAQTSPLAADEALVINGVSIQLTAGMTQSDVISKVNDYSDETGVTASATDASGTTSGNYLTLRSIGYGSSRTISAISDVAGGAASSGIGTTLVTESSPGSGTGAAGTDVAGTINGEAATGNGQMLTGNEGNATTDGLRLRITGSATGDYGTVVFSKGIASLLSDFVTFVTDKDTGSVAHSRSSIETQIDRLEDDILQANKRLIAHEQRLIDQFTAMESAMANLQSQGQYLAQQLVGISANWG